MFELSHKKVVRQPLPEFFWLGCMKVGVQVRVIWRSMGSDEGQVEM